MKLLKYTQNSSKEKSIQGTHIAMLNYYQYYALNKFLKIKTKYIYQPSSIFNFEELLLFTL